MAGGGTRGEVDWIIHIADAVDEEVDKFIQMALDTARKILTENRSKLVLLAERLIAKETIEGEDLEEVFNEIDPQKPKKKPKKTAAPVRVEPVGETEKEPKPKKAPPIPRLVPEQTPAPSE